MEAPIRADPPEQLSDVLLGRFERQVLDQHLGALVLPLDRLPLVVLLVHLFRSSLRKLGLDLVPVNLEALQTAERALGRVLCLEPDKAVAHR
jgi:hypothetical protein